MSIGWSEDHRALADAIADWAGSEAVAEAVKRSEESGPSVFEPLWKGVSQLGLAGIAVPEAYGGAGGSFLDAAVAVEACARAMVPGPLTPTVTAAAAMAGIAGSEDLLAAVSDGTVTFALALNAGSVDCAAETCSGDVAPVWGAGLTTHLLVPAEDGYVVVLCDDPGVTLGSGPLSDLSTRVGSVRLDAAAVALRLPGGRERVESLAATLAASTLR